VSTKEDAVVFIFSGIGCLLLGSVVLAWCVLLPTVGVLYLLGYLGG